jgi:hypothetical protein
VSQLEVLVQVDKLFVLAVYLGFGPIHKPVFLILAEIKEQGILCVFQAMVHTCVATAV